MEEKKIRKFQATISEDPELIGAFFFTSYIRLPKTQKEGYVNLMLDTGAGCTVLGETDLKKMDVEISSLAEAPNPIAGWGGKTQAFILSDVCIFLTDDDNQCQLFEMPEIICGKNPKGKKGKSKMGVQRTWNATIPSVIGRDFLLRHNLIVHIDIAEKDIFLASKA